MEIQVAIQKVVLLKNHVELQRQCSPFNLLVLGRYRLRRIYWLGMTKLHASNAKKEQMFLLIRFK